MRFNFSHTTHFETPMVAPLISVFGLEHLKNKSHEFSPEETAAFDALLNHLPMQRVKMRTNTRSNDAAWHELSTYSYDDDDCAEYYDSDKLMVCVCVPGRYSKILDPVYNADVSQHFSPTEQGLGWEIAKIAPHLHILDNLCDQYDITFNSEHIKAIVAFQKEIADGTASIYEFSADDYAYGSGVVLYNCKKQAYFAGVVHNSLRTSTLLGANIFPNEDIAFQSLDRHEKKHEWIAIPAHVRLNGMVASDDEVLNEALGVAQQLRMDNQLLEDENARLRAQLGMEPSVKRLKM